MSEILKGILAAVRREIAEAKRSRSIRVLENWLKNAPPVLDFKNALKGGGLIAEIKRRSPSAGDMLIKNVNDAPDAYEKSPIVHAVSILTNNSHFGFGIDVFKKARSMITKPMLRKDFILEEYQIVEARAFGADAILLMGNILDKETYQKLHTFARGLGLHVLCESHTHKDIQSLPIDAEICGINSRQFDSSDTAFYASRLIGSDLTTGFIAPKAFHLIDELPETSIKVAESAVTPENFVKVMARGFDAALVGTSLLKSTRGVQAELDAFEKAMTEHPGITRYRREPVSV